MTGAEASVLVAMTWRLSMPLPPEGETNPRLSYVLTWSRTPGASEQKCPSARGAADGHRKRLALPPGPGPLGCRSRTFPALKTLVPKRKHLLKNPSFKIKWTVCPLSDRLGFRKRHRAPWRGRPLTRRGGESPVQTRGPGALDGAEAAWARRPSPTVEPRPHGGAWSADPGASEPGSHPGWLLPVLPVP